MQHSYYFSLYANKNGRVLSPKSWGEKCANLPEKYCFMGEWQPSQNGTLPQISVTDGKVEVVRFLRGKWVVQPDLTKRYTTWIKKNHPTANPSWLLV